MVKENLSGLIILLTKVNLSKIIYMDKGYTNGKMDVYLKEPIEII